MASAAAALLDQLMGRNRNAGAGEKTAREHWSDPEVCKYYLCGFCPSQLFTNTRSDVGVCDKIHDETFQIAYEASPDKGKKGYEERFLDYLEKLVRDLDRRIQRGKERLDRSAEANKKAFDDEGGSMFSEKLQELTKQIALLINQSEELGASGRVEEAQELISKVEELEREKEKERSAMMLKANVPQTVAGFEIDPGNFHEKNEICDVCGCFLIIGDTQARMDAHLMGKQHMGFARIRSTIVELKQAREERLKKEMEERIARRESHNERSSPTDSRSHDRGRRRSHRSRSKDRHRSSSRDKRKRRSRSREKKRSRSRSREKKERSRSGERKSPLGERKRKSRSRSRERKRRSRSRDKKSRSGEQKRKSRSRSRERKRSRSRSRDKKRRRSRSRSYDRRTSYSRDRNRRRSYRSRSTDRSRHHRHRSNSRSRSRSRERGEKKNDSSKEERSEGMKNHDENQTSKDDIMEANDVQGCNQID